jgi:uncharacterized protein YidB (DUF937 family)
MGLLDILKGAMGGKKAPAASQDPISSALGGLTGGGGLGALAGLGGGNPLLKMLLPLLMGGGAAGALGQLGGLGGLLGKFKGAGMESKVNSWVGTGANEELSPDEVHNALGADTIDAMAKESGLPHDEVKSGLASMLPNIVNQLSPGGSLPGADQLGGLMKGLDLGKLLG